MPNKKNAKNSPKKEHDEEPGVGTITEEIEVPVSSEVVFRKIWQIKNFIKTISKNDLLDSPEFQCTVNGKKTFWNISIRFWKGANGKKVTNPVVICLNSTGCETEEIGQARVRFQFGVRDELIRFWECSPISNVVLNLENKKELLSVGYKSLGILDRHIDKLKDVKIMVKLQIIQSDEDAHSLSQDMARLLSKKTEDMDTLIQCSPSENTDENVAPVKAHSWVIRLRSHRLSRQLQDFSNNSKNIKYKLDLSEYPSSLIQELIRYIYTDKVENAETYANRLLPMASRYDLPGLSALCERTLLETLTPANVANILLIADQCGCENLRKAALDYCEKSEEIKENVHIGKSLAWRVMEMVNPDLFLEACESIGSSSSNLDSPASWSD